MKFWKVFIGLLLTPALQAQIPIDYTYSPYYPGTAAYYPRAYSPGGCYPYYPQPCYLQFPYVCAPFSTFDTNQTINTLTRRVQQLNETVQVLEAQISAAQTHLLQARALEATARSAERPAEPLTLILKNGKCIAAQGYAIMGQSLWILTQGGSERVALSDLDMAATQRANTKWGALFRNGT
jgi:hypothetical protein